MIEETTTYRSKEQVLADLSKALGFTPESLEANRQGRLTGEQHRQFSGRCARPAVMAVFCFLAPLLVWTALTAAEQHVSFFSAFGIFLDQLIHLGKLIEDQGKLAALARLGSTLACFGAGAYTISRISLDLYFDLLERKVVKQEGRIVAREQEINREDGRDPIERYFFGLKTQSFEVNLAAFRAIENGGSYVIYQLPRTQLLVSMEPSP